jgi:hypothetical protein
MKRVTINVQKSIIRGSKTFWTPFTLSIFPPLSVVNAFFSEKSFHFVQIML